MAITENEINMLNNSLESDSFDIAEFDKLYQTIWSNNTFKIKLIDFEFYNEKRLEEAIKEKIVCVELLNFERAASNRDLELECQKYIDLKSEFKIEKSAFHYEQKYLMYFYLGTAKNDKLVREYLKKETL
jgi:hypothetical protein